MRIMHFKHDHALIQLTKKTAFYSDDRHRSSHDRHDRQHSSQSDPRSSHRRSNDPISPTVDDHRKQVFFIKNIEECKLKID